VRRSTDRGRNWSADVRTVTNAKNPAVAINSLGRLGFVRQDFTGTRWVTTLEITGDAWATTPVSRVLHTAPSNAPARTFLPYLGDYIRLITVGENWYGVFSGNNTPDNANFPSGVIYQRNADWTSHTLLDLDNVTPVAVSIDPFFFQFDERPDVITITREPVLRTRTPILRTPITREPITREPIITPSPIITRARSTRARSRPAHPPRRRANPVTTSTSDRPPVRPGPDPRPGPDRPRERPRERPRRPRNGRRGARPAPQHAVRRRRAAVARPRAARAHCARAGVRCETRYLTIEFAQAVGLADYAWVVNELPYTAFAGEWVFAERSTARGRRRTSGT
jgi:hypothetical protein